MSVELRYVNVSRLNVRGGPGLKYPIIQVLKYGTPVTIFTDTKHTVNGITWVQRAKPEYRGLWLALDFLTPAVSPSKVGAHVSMHNYDKSHFLSLLSHQHALGRPVPFLTVLGPEEIPLSSLLAASPETTIALRVYPGGGSDLNLTAKQYLMDNVVSSPDRRLAHFHIINNENGGYTASDLSWWIQQMSDANVMGYKLALPNWATGNPPIEFWSQQFVHNFLRYIRDTGNLFTLHEYFRNDADWELFRFIDHCIPLLPPDLRNNMPRMAFTEWGQQGLAGMPLTGFQSLVKTYQSRLAPYPWILGAATWALGDTGNDDWKGDNFNPVMDGLASA